MVTKLCVETKVAIQEIFHTYRSHKYLATMTIQAEGVIDMCTVV
jgi:hypothetical protein